MLQRWRVAQETLRPSYGRSSFAAQTDWRVRCRGGGFGYWFHPYGESLLAVAPKGTKRSCPSIRVSLRSTSLTPSLFQGPAYKGRPWPFTPLAASMRLTPFHNDCVRPAGKGRCPGSNLLFRRGKVLAFVSNVRSHAERGNDHQKLRLFAVSLHSSSRRRGPRVPSGGRVEVLWRGAFGMDAKRGTMGQGWPFVTTLGTVPERGKSGRRSDPYTGRAFSLLPLI